MERVAEYTWDIWPLIQEARIATFLLFRCKHTWPYLAGPIFHSKTFFLKSEGADSCLGCCKGSVRQIHSDAQVQIVLLTYSFLNGIVPAQT